MKKNKVSINVISSFNNANFSGLLKSSKNFSWSINELGYNQVFQTLTNSNSKIWKKRRNITLIWTTPESISSEFKKLENGNIINPNKIKNEVEYFCSCVESVKKYSDIVLIPNWILKQQNEGSLTLSYLKDSSLEYNLSLMNQCLYEKFGKTENLYILNSSKWLTNCGSVKAYNSKLWYLMKNPFSNDFFKEAILDLENLYTSIKGQNKKLLILDLDNTLWGGIVGDIGWKNLRLGGHDHLGEAFQDFQTKIKSLSKNGLLLALASKNEEAVAIEAIKKHPEMILSMNDFVTHKINWDDKAKNISEIVDELNIGLQSVVFFDDSPAERDRVKKTLPEVFVPELPKDPTDYFTFLSKLRCFDTTHISAEDKVRGKLYKVENKRTSLKKKIKSLSQWIETLELEILIENIKKENKPRCLQLLNKTNQMNLSTRRLNEQQFVNWTNKNSNYLWTVRAKDKFGDYGIIGILSLSIKDKVVHIVDFVLSCRVVGRCIENVLIEFVKDFCKHNKISKINGKYKKTNKNSLIYEFLKKLNIISKNKFSFVLLPKKNNIVLPKIKVIKPSLRKK
jgi:FkbH-like protein